MGGGEFGLHRLDVEDEGEWYGTDAVGGGVFMLVPVKLPV